MRSRLTSSINRGWPSARILQDPERDIIYIAYTEFKTRYTTLYADELPFLTSPITETTIRLVRSTDGGATWSDPIGVSPTVFQAEGASEEGEGGASAVDAQTDDGEINQQAQQEGEAAGTEADQTVQGPQPAVMADGTVVVAYLDTTLDGVQEGLATIMVTLSEDGGRTFGEPVQAGVFREIHFRPRNSFFRWWGAAFPQVTVGPDDEIYVAVTAKPGDKPTDDGDIFLLRSLDKGENWEAPVRINADDTDRIQFFPAIDVAPDGTLHAMWGDMRDDPQEARFHIYYSESDDQGETWGFVDEQIGLNVPETRVTDFASNSLRGFPGGRFLGDYFGLAATEDDVYLVWADTRLGEFAGRTSRSGSPASGPSLRRHSFSTRPVATLGATWRSRASASNPTPRSPSTSAGSPSRISAPTNEASFRPMSTCRSPAKARAT